MECNGRQFQNTLMAPMGARKMSLWQMIFVLSKWQKLMLTNVPTFCKSLSRDYQPYCTALSTRVLQWLATLYGETDTRMYILDGMKKCWSDDQIWHLRTILSIEILSPHWLKMTHHEYHEGYKIVHKRLCLWNHWICDCWTNVKYIEVSTFLLNTWNQISLSKLKGSLKVSWHYSIHPS